VFAPNEAKTHGITAPEKVIDYRDALLKGPAQLGAGLLAVISLLFTIGVGIATFRQTADQEANQQFFKAAQMAITGKAAQMAITGLDDSKATATTPSEELKVAANYALRKIVLEQPEYCDMVTSILIGQINKNTSTQKEQRKPVNSSVSAATLVLGGIPPCASDQTLRLTDQYLVGANFGNSTFLRGVDLRASTLWSAYFGRANLDSARFDGAGMADENSYGEGFEAAISDKNAWEYLRYNYIINFENSTLRCATFLNTSVAGASFVNTDLYYTDFRNTNLSGADFRGAKNFNTTILEDACFDPKRPPKVDKTMQNFFQKAISRKDCDSGYKYADPRDCRDMWFWAWR
jgi:uncharacterized protein YjbI with pentapeptide repeats